MERRTICLILVALVVLAGLPGCGSNSDPAEPGPAKVSDPVYIYAGTGQSGLGEMGKAPRKTSLYWPQDVIFDPDGRPVVIDNNNHRIITVDVDGHFVRIAGGAFGDPCPLAAVPCVDVVADGATLNHPTHVAFDTNGNMVLCAWHNSELFLLNMATGLMDRFCGTGIRPCFGPVQNDPQDALTACVDLPAAVAFDSQGRLCFTDEANMIIRMIDESGVIHTIAGTQPIWDSASGRFNIQYGFSGDGGPATEAKLSFPRGQAADVGGKICFDGFGNMYIADTSNHAVRMVDAVTGIITRIAGGAPVDNGVGGYVGDPGYSGDGGPATGARLLEPRDVAVDTDGTVYIADTGNHVIRMVRPDGIISTLVGVHRDFFVSPLLPDEVLAEDGASAKSVHLTKPYGVAVDSNGKLWISDTENNVIRILERP